ncbi:vegetative cell wall protein gp1-like [Zerene cesonia]|uniref:vegetative cell wall protein gp1-like n=1 Tax=Zerene cesonia TaxID=33412 RepID=UPI0018E53C69|nr:vegetative cell wall protein gp1-like [Zerene cesonia]
MASYGRAGSLAATPGEKLMELLRPSAGTPRRHSTAACASAQPRPSGFVYCPSDALPYCPPSRLAPPRPVKLPPPIQPVPPPQPPPVPQRTAPVVTPLPVPPAPPRRSSPQPPKRVPPPTPPRPVATDPTGIRRNPPPRIDCNRNPPPPQPPVPRRPPQKMPDNPLPPPQQNQQMKRSPSSGSNISVRQDSNVSSDSFSQTSSPSYTTKTMEAPLLPQQHLNKSLNAKIARGLLLKEQQEKENANSSITKSMSTPASLQTIVRFQNGSNMSLHHRGDETKGREAFAQPWDSCD